MLMEKRAARMILLGWALVILGLAKIVLELLFGHFGWWMAVVMCVSIIFIGVGLGLLRRYYQVQQTLKDIRANRGKLP